MTIKATSDVKLNDAFSKRESDSLNLKKIIFLKNELLSLNGTIKIKYNWLYFNDYES